METRASHRPRQTSTARAPQASNMGQPSNTGITAFAGQVSSGPHGSQTSVYRRLHRLLRPHLSPFLHGLTKEAMTTDALDTFSATAIHTSSSLRLTCSCSRNHERLHLNNKVSSSANCHEARDAATVHLFSTMEHNYRQHNYRRHSYRRHSYRRHNYRRHIYQRIVPQQHHELSRVALFLPDCESTPVFEYDNDIFIDDIFIDASFLNNSNNKSHKTSRTTRAYF
ncbi:hypothetical protein BDV97DRAFT_177573 [Delphinella strobiligena]|nr:hypothetical protein BDV97DRAFT_177573 [Delphinella strobiligena]